ncbi:hypothetical protein [Nesterenkonia pannonica]|uniref:hypothetical protein n=1 Tax=Nesterenkonia pannonica TaxID=1548602 RepID=UPI002164CB0B|nr:hypothetical protein [Nesterenkonia pannonica]
MEALQEEWTTNPRWKNVTRDYSATDVVKLQGTVQEEDPRQARRGEALEAAHRGARSKQVHQLLGALSGNQAVNYVKVGLRAIYLSGWQVVSDANNSGHTYPDQSLYPANSVPTVVRRINNALMRADQIDYLEGVRDVEDYVVPIVADAEVSFGGPSTPTSS